MVSVYVSTGSEEAQYGEPSQSTFQNSNPTGQ